MSCRWPWVRTKFRRIYTLFFEKNYYYPIDKRHRETIISGLTCLWGSRATNIMIKRRHTKPYEKNMCSNKVEYSTNVGAYCTMHDVKVPFFMPEFLAARLYVNRLPQTPNKMVQTFQAKTCDNEPIMCFWKQFLLPPPPCNTDQTQHQGELLQRQHLGCILYTRSSGIGWWSRR